MNTNTYKLPLSFNLIIELIKQLPKKDKLTLSKELEKDLINTKLTGLLKNFKTDDLALDTITDEVVKERRKRYAAK